MKLFSQSASPARRAKIVLVALAMGALVTTGAVIALSPRASPITPPSAPSVAHIASPPRPTTSTGLIATLVAKTAAFRSPGGAQIPSIAPTWYGSPLSLPVIATTVGFLEVRLPTRPNGSTAWVRRGSVGLYDTPYRIVVNLGTRHLLLYRDGKVILDAPAGVGTTADPTPTGHFFVAFFATAPSPAWGPFVLVTSAHSNAISDWEESGDAIVAIHGPLGEGAAIGLNGARISHGCLRLHDGDLAQLRVVPDGSPIDIIA